MSGWFTFFLIPFVIIAAIFSPEIYSQGAGVLTGKIIDKTTGEELIGANVLLTGTTTGASSDIDGLFRINNIPEGVFSIKVSYVSYQTLIIENIEIKNGKETVVNISLEQTSTELQEVVVTAEAIKSTETSIIKTMKNSGNIVEGISAELIKKNNSSTGADVLKRMTGVTISEGKYVYIRGVGDRYNNTLLNGANVPGTDPEKKSFSYDLFPASLIENVITSKTFTPDKPADFSGGLVQINTVEFPPAFFIDVNTSTSFNSVTSGKEFLTYHGGGKDFLGTDDGTRSLPSTITEQKVVRGNYSDAALTDITASFKNNWNTSTSPAPVNGSFKLNLGDKVANGEGMFGYIGSLSYSNLAEQRDFEQNSYTFEGPRYMYNGSGYSHSVVWGGLLNLSYKFGPADKLSLKNIYNRNSDDETVFYSGEYSGASQYREVTNLRFVSRSLLSNQLIGEHQFGFLYGTGLEWNINYARSDRNEPDARRYVYARDINETSDPMRFQLDQSLATRFYGDLLDQSYSANTALNIKLFPDPELPKLKTGFTIERKTREFDARTFGFRNAPGGDFIREDSILQLSVENIFTEENINGTFAEVLEITKPSDSYSSEQDIYAGFLMFDVNLLADLRISAGIRYENSTQKLHSFSQTGAALNINDNYKDLLPAVNIKYIINDLMNLRFAYSRTLARPEFRELAPFSYFDFIANELVTGNENLKRATVQNFDIRYELFPGTGELAALSLFYKKFNQPIEQILIASSSFEPIRSYENGETANNYGIELEVRKSLSFISSLADGFSFVGNASYIKSEINVSANNGFQEAVRPMQGQPEYILNLGLYYDNFDLGFESSVVFNKVGLKIAKVGYAGLGDVVELPRDQIDLSFSQRVFSNFNIKLGIKDLLDQDTRFIQRTPDGDKTSELQRTGRTFLAGLSYQFN